MNVHCFYHSADLDGHCSGAIVRQWCEKEGHTYLPHGVNYGKFIDWLFGGGEQTMAVIVDFTPEGGRTLTSRDILEKMSLQYGHLIWIDHHSTAIESVGDKQFDGIRRVGTAACVLTWEHFFPGEEIPEAVRLLGAYDVFDRSDKDKWKNDILPFQYGMRLMDTNPDGTDAKGLWAKLLDETANEQYSHGYYEVGWISAEGMTILKYECLQNTRTAKSAAYDCMFDGMLCCAVNARGNSLLLDSFARPEHKMRILWTFDRNKWRVHLYDNGHADVHCGEIAKRFGGGGHKGAAGFELHRDNFFPEGIIPTI
jgi:oligoribonuclease NrnB/cAMP/cGMP phosphodiesterase (DHH superfamily)